MFVRDGCYNLSVGEVVLASGELSNTSVIGPVNHFENYVLEVTPVKASASAVSARMNGEAELWHRRSSHVGFENFKRVVGMVKWISASVADSKSVLGTVCVRVLTARRRALRTIARLRHPPSAKWLTLTSMGP